MTRSLRLLTGLIFVALALGSTERVLSQAAMPSADQLEMLGNLTPEQREQIMRQITGGGSSGQSSTSSSSKDDQRTEERSRMSRDAQLEAERRLRGTEEDEEREPLIPVFKAEDSLAIEVDFRKPETETPQLPLQPGTLPSQANAPLLPNNAATPNHPAPEVSREPKVELTAEERERLKSLIDLVRSRNPYQLSKEGVLTLPGFAGIPLAGLTEVQATLRLKVEPALRDLDVRLTRLPLKKLGTAALKPFGYDLFEHAPSTFAPVNNVPVPADYIVGPGDELNVQLYGNQNRSLKLTVGRDGRVDFPELGPVNVGGQRFSSVQASIESRVERQMIGVRASVSMGDTRSIRVFVLGEARVPGSYTVSGLGTMTSALFAAGGVKRIGSLRNVQLKRQGAVVAHLDLYDLLIRGDTSDDAKLLSGDVIFIPPVARTVTVDGEVQRQAIYELRNEQSVAEVIALAGGLTAEADATRVTLTHLDTNRHRTALHVDLAETARPAGAQVGNGDLLHVARLRPTLDAGVMVQGHVYRAGVVAYRDGLRLSEVIPSVDDLRPNADLHYVLIRRELSPDRRVAVLSADLSAALNAPGSDRDVQLMPRDRITVFDLESGRDRVIKPLVDELRLQSNIVSPTELVRVDGRVKVPGEYPLEPGMKVSDLIRAGGGLADAAYGGKAELTRYTVSGGESRQTELISVDLTAAQSGDPASDVVLQPFDALSIKEVPEWGEQETVSLKGEVRFPGRYAIKRGETLNSVIARAGGLTAYAFAEGSVFTREDLKKREQEQLDVLAARLQNDLATLALQGAAANQSQAGTALSVGQSLLAQVKTSKAVGRLVIDLPQAMRASTGANTDILLRNGDQLIVPRYQQEVTVIGEVQNATSHLYRSELNRNDYIDMSGGATRRADRERIYVVRANGSVVSSESKRWFRSGTQTVRPGDTVVVPLDTQRIPALPFWQAVTQIIYNLAISAAAVNSF
jgi:protein involved in polysaccharide export with SLBB domain